MTIRLHDTMAGAARELVPLEPGHVRIYSCGPTVYGPAHVGNFRSFLFADLLVRYLRYRGPAGDVGHEHHRRRRQDHQGRRRRGRSRSASSRSVHARLLLEDATTLGMTMPDVMPTATEHIPQMVELIGKLLERGNAYRTDDGSIFFRIASWPAYGRLARLDPEGMRVGERVEADDYGKDDVRDFAALEGAQGRRAELGDGHRTGPAGLAHRMLGHEHGLPRAVVRHPHRRRRPDLPAPPGRDRPERGGHGPDVRRTTGSTARTSRWAARRCRSRSATSIASATCWAGASPRAPSDWR